MIPLEFLKFPALSLLLMVMIIQRPAESFARPEIASNSFARACVGARLSGGAGASSFRIKTLTYLYIALASPHGARRSVHAARGASRAPSTATF